MSLFTRIIGSDENLVKIPVHHIQSLVTEFDRGRLNFSDIVMILNLSSGEQQDLVNFVTHLSNIVGSKTPVSSRVFNYLYLGENGITQGRDYTDETLFWQMLQNETSS